MTQGDSLDMFAYGIGVTLLIKRLEAEFTDIAQPRYADDTGAIDMFKNIGFYFNLLKRFGLCCEYCPKPPKIVLIVQPNNLESRKRYVLIHGFKVCTGARYLGGYIGDDESKCDCLKLRTKTW